MTTYLLHDFKTLTTGVDGGLRYICSEFEHCGLSNKLVAYFHDKTEEAKIPTTNQIAVSGEQDPQEVEIILRNAVVSPFPSVDNWETFIVSKLFAVGATIELTETTEHSYLSGWKNNIYVWCDFNKTKLTLNKFEFGRYLPLEKPEHKGKSSSWTKGIFTNHDKLNVRFLQTSFDGEEGSDYQLHYSDESKQKLINALQIPLEIGWTEEDFRIGRDNFYKAGASITIDRQNQRWVYTLLDIGEQDLPMFGDKLDQWLRLKWGDSFINNNRRRIDITIVQPMCEK